MSVKNFKGATLGMSSLRPCMTDSCTVAHVRLMGAAVDIREYYDDAGELKPGQKGISLTLEQWSKFKAALPALDQKLMALG